MVVAIDRLPEKNHLSLLCDDAKELSEISNAKRIVSKLRVLTMHFSEKVSSATVDTISSPLGIQPNDYVQLEISRSSSSFSAPLHNEDCLVDEKKNCSKPPLGKTVRRRSRWNDTEKSVSSTDTDTTTASTCPSSSTWHLSKSSCSIANSSWDEKRDLPPTIHCPAKSGSITNQSGTPSLSTTEDCGSCLSTEENVPLSLSRELDDETALITEMGHKSSSQKIEQMLLPQIPIEEDKFTCPPKISTSLDFTPELDARVCPPQKARDNARISSARSNRKRLKKKVDDIFACSSVSRGEKAMATQIIPNEEPSLDERFKGLMGQSRVGGREVIREMYGFGGKQHKELLLCDTDYRSSHHARSEINKRLLKAKGTPKRRMDAGNLSHKERHELLKRTREDVVTALKKGRSKDRLPVLGEGSDGNALNRCPIGSSFPVVGCDDYTVSDWESTQTVIAGNHFAQQKEDSKITYLNEENVDSLFLQSGGILRTVSFLDDGEHAIA